MRLPLRHFALGPVLWSSIERAEQASPRERTAWQDGVASTAALVDNNRGVYGPLLGLGGAIVGAFAVPGPWYVRVLLAGLFGLFVLWLVPTLVAAAMSLRAPYAQRNAARQDIKQLGLKLENDLAAADRRRVAEVKAERDAFESKSEETEQIRGLLGASEKKNRELEAELKEAKRSPRESLVLAAGTSGSEVVREKIDAMVRDGFVLYEELNTGPEATQTDEEGRGISFPMFPPDSKWDPVYRFDQSARRLLKEYDPGLLFAYADAVNAAQRKRERRERQRNEAQQKLPNAKQMPYMIDRIHRQPAEQLECFVSALVDVKKQL